MNKKSRLFSNINSTKDKWLGTGSGYSGIAYTFNATGGYASVELCINRGS